MHENTGMLAHAPYEGSVLLKAGNQQLSLEHKFLPNAEAEFDEQFILHDQFPVQILLAD